MRRANHARALALAVPAGSVRTMAHPTLANTTVAEPVTGGCPPDGFGGLRITGCWINEAPPLEGDTGLGCDSGTQV